MLACIRTDSERVNILLRCSEGLMKVIRKAPYSSRWALTVAPSGGNNRDCTARDECCDARNPYKHKEFNFPCARFISIGLQTQLLSVLHTRAAVVVSRWYHGTQLVTLTNCTSTYVMRLRTVSVGLYIGCYVYCHTVPTSCFNLGTNCDPSIPFCFKVVGFSLCLQLN